MGRRTPNSVAALDALGRVRLSRSFFLREFLYSEVAAFHGIANIPRNPDLAIAMGRRLCTELLEPLQDHFGKIWVRSGYRTPELNAFCNRQQRAGKPGYSCASNSRSAADHIWDLPDAKGQTGATACIVIPWFADRLTAAPNAEAAPMDWRAMAWWIHDHLPYSNLCFFPKMFAFNIRWHQAPVRRIDSYVAPRGCLTKPGMANHRGDHSRWYAGIPDRVESG